MARQQRFDWFLSHQRRQLRRLRAEQTKSPRRRRRPVVESLEPRELLSVNSGELCTSSSMAADKLSLMDANAPVAIPEAMFASEEEYVAANGDLVPEEFDARTPWDDEDPDLPGIQITYSYTNFLDGNLPGGLTVEELRAATEEAFGLWASVAPLFFIEEVDSGPGPDDLPTEGYPAADHPTIRIGHQFIDGPSSTLAFAFFPNPDGVGGDVFFDNGDTWNINPSDPGFDVIEVMTHELGHALGLGHEFTEDAIMNPFYGGRFSGPGTGFLLDDDIAGIQALYGASEEGGGVFPLPAYEVNTLEDGDDTEIMVNPETMMDELVDTTPGVLTLREAIKLANFSSDGSEVTFDRDLFPDFEQAYTITLDETLGPLEITNGIDIRGPGLTLGQDADLLTIVAPDPSEADGDGMKIFVIDNSDPDGEIPDTIATVIIGGLSITGGDSNTAGGAISTTEDLILDHVNIYDNYSRRAGGAIYSTLFVALLSSTAENNRAEDEGGAIHALDGVYLDSSTLHDNESGGQGGAIYSEQYVWMMSSTADNNLAADDGGAIHTSGGVYVDSSTLYDNESGDKGGAISAEGQGTELIVVSSTISGNTADGNGGAIHNIDDNPTLFRVLHSTVVNNSSNGSGGGIYFQDGVLSLEHSIVANNTDVAGAPNLDNINLFANPVILARYNAIENANGANLTQQDPNIIADNGGLISPAQWAKALEELADNGGPTLTRVPTEDGAFLLNAGNPDIPVAPENDQRGFGFERIFEGVIDIGAIESGGFEQILTVNSLLDKSDLDGFGIDLTPDEVTLREAIEFANMQLGSNLINFAPSLNGGTIELSASHGELLISDALTIDASALTAGLTITGAAADAAPAVNNGGGIRVLRIDDGDANTYANIELLGLTLTGGDVTGHGGAIHSLENLILRQVSVIGNYAVGRGGGVYHKAGATGGTLLIDSSTIANNEATDDGGGLWNDTNLPAEPNPDPDPNPITGVIINSTVSSNVAGDEGGGIMNFDGQLEIRHSTITLNQADHGSGVVSFGDAATKTLVYSSIISGNVINENNPLDPNDDTGFDVQRSRNVAFNSFESLGYNLIGNGDALLNFDNNDLTEILDPQLGPLANNGGKTQTHELLSGSPAIDSGDPNTVLPLADATDSDVVVTEFDQRGEGFPRIADGDNDGEARLDIGSFELPPLEPDADFDSDNDVDGTDFLIWQRGFGTPDATLADGDSNSDGVVDGEDLNNWMDQYGEQMPAAVTAPQTAETSAAPDRPAPVARRAEYRQTIDGSSPQLGVLSAAAQNYFSRDQAASSDQTGEDPEVHRHNDALMSRGTTSASNLATRADTSPQSDVVDDDRSESEQQESLDRAFERIGEEQPGRLLGLLA